LIVPLSGFIAFTHLENDGREQPLFAIHGGAGQRQTFHCQRGAADAPRERFVVPQAVELAGLESAGCQPKLDASRTADVEDHRINFRAVLEESAQN
jgi:hypothetical protein